jgi:hypothetical protein
MSKPKRMINDKLQRKPFEEIFNDTFAEFKDNLLISEDIRNKIVKEAVKRIREQLQGLSRQPQI